MEPLTIYSTTRMYTNDVLTPMAAYMTWDQPQAFFLESVEKGASIGRYSIMGCDPLVRVTGHVDGLDITHNNASSTQPGNALQLFRQLSQSVQHHNHGHAPISLGFFGYFSWEVIQLIEKLTIQSSPSGTLFDFQMPRWLVVFDHAQQTLYITYSDTVSMDDASTIIDACYQRLMAGMAHVTGVFDASGGAVDWSKIQTNWSKAGYEQGVETIQSHIKEGDIFQAVLSQRFSIQRKKDPLSVYRSLRHINPSPYMFFFNYGSYHLIGSSPEILVKATDGVATLRPIAGTRRRSSSQDDSQLIDDLKADEKEVAEHIMLVDLGRNDLGRVCDYETIHMNDMMTIERYSHVLHMVTNIEGTLREGVTPVDLFSATFPAGTVSGAPKVRAIQIINEIEPTPRGIYSGSVGYFNFNNDCDFCIAIRTIVADDSHYHVQAGAGVVHDSVPTSELNETKSKAEGVIMACLESEVMA